MIENILQNIKDLKNKKIYLVIAASVVILLVLLLIGDNSEKINTETLTEKSQEQTRTEKETEEELKKIISQIKGVSNVNVMITFCSSGEYIYAENSKSENNGDKYSVNSEIVLYESVNGNDEGLVVSVKNPDISGVAVVCSGGDNLTIKAEITKLVTSLFGIGSDRVYVGSYAP